MVLRAILVYVLNIFVYGPYWYMWSILVSVVLLVSLSYFSVSSVLVSVAHLVYLANCCLFCCLSWHVSVCPDLCLSALICVPPLLCVWGSPGGPTGPADWWWPLGRGRRCAGLTPGEDITLLYCTEHSRTDTWTGHYSTVQETTWQYCTVQKISSLQDSTVLYSTLQDWHMDRTLLYCTGRG